MVDQETGRDHPVTWISGGQMGRVVQALLELALPARRELAPSR
jgi:hypothetical protein